MKVDDDRMDEERYASDLFARIRVEDRPGFREDLRARLIAQVVPIARARRSAPWWSLRIPRVAIAAFAVVAMLAGGGGLAAGASLPGDALFGVKRAAEEIVLALAPTDSARVELLAAQAAARLAEMRRASGAGTQSAAASEYASAIVRLAERARDLAAHDPDATAVVRAATALQQAVEVLRALESTLPDEAQDGIRRAIERAGEVRPGPRTAPPTAPTRAPGVAPATTDARPAASPAAPSPAGPIVIPTRPADRPTPGAAATGAPTPPAPTSAPVRPPVPSPPAPSAGR